MFYESDPPLTRPGWVRAGQTGSGNGIDGSSNVHELSRGEVLMFVVGTMSKLSDFPKTAWEKKVCGFVAVLRNHFFLIFFFINVAN